MFPEAVHAQTHHRPRQKPRLVRYRGFAREEYDGFCQGDGREAGQERQGQGRTQSVGPGQYPGERRRQLEYKARLYGSELRVVPPFHTSQTCAACGRVDPESRKGCGRLFACVHCGHEDDADHNASVEIEARARRTGGTVTDSTRSVPKTRVPATGRRRMREAPKPAHAS